MERRRDKEKKKLKIAFIGGGAMGEAMIRCLLTKKVVMPQDVTVSDVSPVRRKLLTREYGVNAVADNKEAAAKADFIVLAVKPQNLHQVIEDVRGLVSQKLVLSIVAGATLCDLSAGLDYPLIVRAMPNMPAQIGEGMTVWTATAEVQQKQRELARLVLAALGKEIYVADEKYLNMATALSASGPAYVFLFIEALIDAGVHVGLPRDMAREMVVQTILGSTHTVEKMGRHPADLRNTVTSPGGTTTEALRQLEKGGFRSLLLEAVAAAYEKAKHL
ncbi:MAG: pyrroline-5-carboxylate reductase [Chloroflexi bacterium RBG_13_51_36]|nr:MAG: pyrroline-5-carboxylate reductase [Chloroflexi bacterium RBG_13_51_36]